MSDVPFSLKVVDSEDGVNPVILVKQDKGYDVHTLKLNVGEAELLLENLEETLEALD